MTESTGGLLIRADASPKTGTGHVMRCRALAHAWKEEVGSQVTFAMVSGAPALEGLLRDEGMEVIGVPHQPGSLEDARHTAQAASAVAARWIVADGYAFGRQYQQAARQQGQKLLVVDDYGHAAGYPAELVLNQNLGAAAELYPVRGPWTRLLLGLSYVLLREEFSGWRGQQREEPARAENVLVTMGGGDADNVTLRVLKALAACEAPLHIRAVAGASNPHLDQLRAAAKASPNVELLHSVKDMPALMDWADLAVSAAGVTCWELAFMGVPMVLLVLADNQQPSAVNAHEAGMALNLGDAGAVSEGEISAAVADLAASADRRRHLAEQGRDLVDGQGAARVVRAMENHICPADIPMRRVEHGDCRRLFDWANEAEVRRQSFSSELISWEDHQRWFARKLQDPRCYHFVGLGEEGAQVGMVRFDVEGEIADISVSVDREHRGGGMGAALIRAGVEALARAGEVAKIHAYIKDENVASVRAFERAGFGGIEQVTVGARGAVRLTFNMETIR